MGKLAEFIEKLKKVKHIEIIACVLLIAVILAVYFSCVSCDDESPVKSADGADYCNAMQIRLENAVNKIAGVSNASIVINWDKSISNSFSSSSENPKATAVIAIVQGADTKAKIDVLSAISTLLDLPIDKIAVFGT